MSHVHLFFLIGRESLKVEECSLWSDRNPTVNSGQYLLVHYCSFEGKTHQEAWDNAQDWLKSDLCLLPEGLAAMVRR